MSTIEALHERNSSLSARPIIEIKTYIHAPEVMFFDFPDELEQQLRSNGYNPYHDQRFGLKALVIRPTTKINWIHTEWQGFQFVQFNPELGVEDRHRFMCPHCPGSPVTESNGNFCMTCFRYYGELSPGDQPQDEDGWLDSNLF